MQPSVMSLPEFCKTFTIECDASRIKIEALLMQEGKPIAFLSKALKGKQLHFSTYEKELLAIVMSEQKCRPYFLVQSFRIKIDQQSLKYLLEKKKIGTPSQQKQISKLLGYDFIVEYKARKENKMADALSRKDELNEVDHEEAEVFVVTSPVVK